jgi:hypothetical protein
MQSDEWVDEHTAMVSVMCDSGRGNNDVLRALVPKWRPETTDNI